jgi:hypothetical protein
MKSITLHVQRDVDGDLVARWRNRESRRTRWPIERAGLFVPPGPYRVRYTLDRNGPLRLRFPGWVEDPKLNVGFVACFLHLPGWRKGRRVSRRVIL